ncbi:Rieske (2Fe-2S) protein [Sporichthya sp.]|uniref:Rieske (2Fe-2S) protein n=1 Tax=Sporichthya sp. TaxID=65475 RepID=UPI001838F732|nr:Rieske 2Fe-2S domain-containing protein [Sporichthya sp.]MBA3743425.1 Rieske 2Fe-2S domain-containing protein [Sporichthya sp.]
MSAADSRNGPEGAEETEVGRRVLLRGMSALGLAAFAAPLAACGSDDEPAAVAGPDATPEATVETTPAATPKGTAAKTPKPEKSPTASAKPSAEATKTTKPEATPKATPKPAAGKLVKASDTPLASVGTIPVNSGYLFEADEYIVTQPTAGKYVGFDSLCTHEGCPVDVFDTPGVMSCSCHSTNFKITDGAVISGPAKKPMPMKPIIVENGQIYRAKQA